MSKKNIIIIFSLCLGLILIVGLIPLTASKYESTTTSKASSDVALYLLDVTHIQEEIKLPELVPSVNPYIYNFSVSNFRGTTRTEINLEYDLSIKTTTNLPLEYKLYLNEDYNSATSTNIFITDEFIADEHGTYFRSMTTSKEYFNFSHNQTNNYTLVVNFPVTYKASKYQNLVESIEMDIKSKQIVE